MTKCFLSHSSKDKPGYVELVAMKLGRERCVYDDFTFEAGMKALEEILKSLDSTDLFVLFLSDSALSSEWVDLEITHAKRLSKEGYLSRIFPIIIDSKITYQDIRIPEWMREEYNLKYISQPTVAVRRIEQRLREIGWQFHRGLEARREIFVGRNETIESFEERIDDFDKSTPSCILASGLQDIGRRTLLKRCCVKANLVSKSYTFPVISLDRQEGIEDFIYKIYDLGLSKHRELKGFMNKPIEEKLAIAIDITKELQSVQERLLIVDKGCIVNGEGNLTEWFSSILDAIKNNSELTFLIAAKSRLMIHQFRGSDHIYALNVPALSRKERNGLLGRYAKSEGLDLDRDSLEFFSNKLSGYPAQVFYTVDLIKDKGLNKAKKDSNLIVEFGESKVQHLLSRYESDQRKLDIIYLLSEFEFTSYEIAHEIVSDEDFFDDFTEELLTASICELLGVNGEYIRVNDAVRDHVRRTRYSLPVKYKERLSEHVNRFLETYEEEDKDVADYFYSLKKALIEGKVIDDTHLIPSHFLKTIKELYDRHKKYKDVTKLADRVLQNEFSLDEGVKHNARYYLCLSLARLREKDRFLSEVHKINGPEHNFLLGFHYRMQGQPEYALKKLMLAVDDRRTEARASRELVQVLIGLEEFDQALALSKQNYEKYPENPFHIHAYLKAFLNSKSDMDEIDFEAILKTLEASVSSPAREMYLEMKARYTAIHKNDFAYALTILDEGIGRYRGSPYLLMARFDIADDSGLPSEMEKSVKLMEEEIDESSLFFRQLIRAKCILLAEKGKKEAAMSLLENRLKGYPEKYMNKLRVRLRNMNEK